MTIAEDNLGVCLHRRPLTCLGVGSAGAGTDTAAPARIYMRTHTTGNPALQPPPSAASRGRRRGRCPGAKGTWRTSAGTCRSAEILSRVSGAWGEPERSTITTAGMRPRPGWCRQRMTDFQGGPAARGGPACRPQFYYETVGGRTVSFRPGERLLSGVWFDNRPDSRSNLSGLELAAGGSACRRPLRRPDLHNAQFVIPRPSEGQRPGFNAGAGYCVMATTTPSRASNPGVQAGISFTNMPYVLNSGTGCGLNSVNTGFYTGRLDASRSSSVMRSRRRSPTPGAEERSIDGQNLGGWYDVSGWKRLTKCAWVDTGRRHRPSTFPGGLTTSPGTTASRTPYRASGANNSAGRNRFTAPARRRPTPVAG